MSESLSLASSLKKTAPWYGVVAFGGVLLALAINSGQLIDRYFASSAMPKVTSTQKGSLKVKPDFVEISVTVKQILAGSAKAATGDLYKKVKDFSEFLTSLKDTTFSLLPLTVSQDLLQVGQKYARNYVTQQEFKIKTTDVNLLKSITDKAVELELGDIESGQFRLNLDNPSFGQLKEHLLKLAKEDAERQAKALGKKLGKVVDYSGSEIGTDVGSSEVIDPALYSSESETGNNTYPEMQISKGESSTAPDTNPDQKDYEMVVIRQKVTVTYSLE